MQLAYAKALEQTFSKLYRGGMYFECQDGWFDLLRQISSQLEDCISRLPTDEQESCYATQVKEKFGTLRLYMTGTATEEMLALIDAATTASETICEICGKPGTMTAQGMWWSVRCSVHHGW